MDISEVKEFLRLEQDYTEEDMLLDNLITAAEEYLTNAGVNKDYTKELYKLAIKLLVSHWYENREVTGKADKLAFSLETIILQLKYTQEEV
ncbi:uncharacterized phage protein (possible DNA packaging) [Tepidibacter thalassicus DSM 15285]|uniref:Uncharacterized phage protein (Possible DNA packaging) n=1 Tax=Tepidibacter thalassicus DSM 15285 TaxID=1123350 RepID=A0A1M5PW92_9FIRM|nr:uncharacterized phage protein (possible DNA packaging) [Tepidibacter thalassicus DSM 15285]